MSPILDPQSSTDLVTAFADGIGELVSIGLKLRTRATRGVDRVAEAQFRHSYELEREELARWLSDHLDEAVTASPYELAATLTDSGQDANLDPKTRGILIQLRKDFLDALPRVSTPQLLPELLEAFRVLGESGTYPPTTLTNFATLMGERIRDWPEEARDSVQSCLIEALPLRPPARGRAASAASAEGRERSEARERPAPSAPTAPDASAAPRSPAPGTEAGSRPMPETAEVAKALFATGPDASRAWAELVATMPGPPELPDDTDALATAMSVLPQQSKEASCKRMRLTLPSWCVACGEAHLRALGRSPAVAETLLNTCQRTEGDPAFQESLRSALPMLVQESHGCTENGVRAAGALVERLWDAPLGEAFIRSLAHSTHPRPGTLRRLLSEGSARLTAHLAAGEPVRDAPWRETLDRAGVPWPDRLALPLSRIPVEELLSVWTREAVQDPALARSLLNVVRDEVASRPEAGALLVALLERQPSLTTAYLEPLLAYLAARPDALQDRQGLSRALSEAVLARPEHLARLPEGLRDAVIPLLPDPVPSTSAWAGALLRGPEWLRHALRERVRFQPSELRAWLDLLLTELAGGAVPDVPDAVAERIATLLWDALPAGE